MVTNSSDLLINEAHTQLKCTASLIPAVLCNVIELVNVTEMGRAGKGLLETDGSLRVSQLLLDTLKPTRSTRPSSSTFLIASSKLTIKSCENGRKVVTFGAAGATTWEVPCASWVLRLDRVYAQSQSFVLKWSTMYTLRERTREYASFKSKSQWMPVTNTTPLYQSCKINLPNVHALTQGVLERVTLCWLVELGQHLCPRHHFDPWSSFLIRFT